MLLLCNIFSGNVLSQTLAINSSYVNNQTTVNNCGTIDFGTTVNNSLTFTYSMSATGNPAGEVRIRLKNNCNSSYIGDVRTFQIITSNSWSNNSYNGALITCNIDASEIMANGSCIYLEFEKTDGAKTISCFVPLTKTLLPSFGLNIPSVSIPCGTLPAVNVGVVNINSSPGTLTYNWSATGWTRNGVSVTNFTTTTNVVTLTPSSLSGTVSNIGVTPILNGVAQPQLVCYASRPAFTTAATITGPAVFCPPQTTATYTIANVAAGNTVQWYSSNTAVATISNPTSTQVTVTKVGFGNFAIGATISNNCSQTAVVSKSVKIINPITINPANFIAAPYINNQWCDQKWHYVEIVYPNQTGITPIFLNVTYNLGTLISQIPGGIIYKFGKGYSGTFFYDINFSNGCTGLEYYSEDFPPLLIKTCAQLPQGRTTNAVVTEKTFKVFPNPANNYFNIQLNKDNMTERNNADASAELYDIVGTKIIDVKLSENTSTLNTANLKKGIYILKIAVNGEIENHQIKIE